MTVLNQLINGYVWDFSSIELSVDGVTIFNSLQEVNYQSSRDRGVLRGTSPIAMGVTRGQTSHEGSISIAKKDTTQFHALLAASGLGGILDGVFDLIVTYADKSVAIPIVDTLEGCRLDNIDNSHSQGTDPLTVSYDLYISRIKYGGIPTDDLLAAGLKSLLP